VITDSRAAPPKALFMGFGDSSLDFELRVRILDIKKRYDVLSDLNFEINNQFSKEGIVIPYPQRDIHIKEGSDKK
jgi:small-conductance mechanosensitive channel